MKKKKKAAPKKAKSRKVHPGMINFEFGEVAYQIDPGRRKVYHRWIEVETAKTCLIMGAYEHGHSQRAV